MSTTWRLVSVDHLRAIADRIDGPEHCAQANELRTIAHDLDMQAQALAQAADAADTFYLKTLTERPRILGEVAAALRKSVRTLIGYRRVEVA